MRSSPRCLSSLPTLKFEILLGKYRYMWVQHKAGILLYINCIEYLMSFGNQLQYCSQTNLAKKRSADFTSKTLQREN